MPRVTTRPLAFAGSGYNLMWFDGPGETVTECETRSILAAVRAAKRARYVSGKRCRVEYLDETHAALRFVGTREGMSVNLEG